MRTMCECLKCLIQCVYRRRVFWHKSINFRCWRHFSCFDVLYYLLVFLFVSTCLTDKTQIEALTVSKCFYEGDFTVFCNKSRLPSSVYHQSNDPTSNRSSNQKTNMEQPIELMHYARVINGLQHNNDSICSYVPGASACARKRTLTECLDKPYCHIKNNWFSLEPECPGNSYYTQFEYDCQPAFTMCDERSHLARNVFSALVYSPNYPRTFRNEKSDRCYLTLNFPNDHHVEITLEFFDLLPTSQCIGDYLEITQYMPVKEESIVKRHTRFNDDTFSNKTFTGGNSKGKENMVKHKKKSSRLTKSERQQRDPSLKWEQLGVMCGIVDSSYTIRASSNIINFKFRPLPSNHQFFTRNMITRENMGFKIFVQAIPPVAPSPQSPHTNHDLSSSGGSKSSTHTPTLGLESLHTPKDHTHKDGSRPSSTISVSVWVLIVIAIIIVVILFIVLGVFLFIFFVKKRRVKSDSNSYSKASSNNATTATSGAKSLGPGPKPTKPTGTDKVASKPNEVTAAASSTTKSNLAPPSPHKSGSISGGGAKVKYVMEPEPRKMQAERPLLLQDLSQSKLLLKFKQENKVEPVAGETTASAAAASVTTAETSAVVEPAPSSASAHVPTPPVADGSSKYTPPLGAADAKTSESPIPSKAASNSSRKSSFQAKMVLMTKTIVPSMSGVYGEDYYDGGGVYGANMDGGSTPPVVITKIERRQSKDASKQRSTPKETTATSTAKSSRKQSKDTTMAVDLEKAYLISAANECHGGEDAVIKAKENNTSAQAPNQPMIGAATTTKHHHHHHHHHHQSRTTKVCPNEDEEKPLKSTTISDNHIENTQQQQQKSNIASNNSGLPTITATTTSTTPRKPAFNPLHVILKDKNKYHTTEYI